MSISDPIGTFLLSPRGGGDWQALAHGPLSVASAPRKSPRAVPLGNRPLHVEVKPFAELDEIRAAWAALADRALERNIFAEPAFALAAAQHLTEGRKAAAVLVWEVSEGPAALVGLFPVLWPRVPILPGIVRGWRSSLMALGVPLVDKLCPERVIEAYLAYLGQRGGRCSAAMFPMLPADGPFARALAAVAERGGRTITMLGAHARAVLRRDSTTRESLSSKKLKELKRQLRRLRELGQVRFERHRDPAAVRAALETFLAIEASGWKRRRGSAIVQDAATATFVRTMTRELAREGRCRIDVLEVGGRAIAAGIMFEAGEKAFFWKIAYDEAYARFSPGVQLTLEITGRQLDRKTILVTDSCAIAQHPMIDHVWRDRMTVADVLVVTQPRSSAGHAAARSEMARRWVRAATKSAYHRLRGGKAS